MLYLNLISARGAIAQVTFVPIGHRMVRGTNEGHYTHLDALLRISIQEME